MTGSIGERFLHDGSAAEGGFVSFGLRMERANSEKCKELGILVRHQLVAFDLQHAGLRPDSCLRLLEFSESTEA